MSAEVLRYDSIGCDEIFVVARLWERRLRETELILTDNETKVDLLNNTAIFGDPPAFEALLDSISTLETRLNRNGASESGAAR